MHLDRQLGISSDEWPVRSVNAGVQRVIDYTRLHTSTHAQFILHTTELSIRGCAGSRPGVARQSSRPGPGNFKIITCLGIVPGAGAMDGTIDREEAKGSVRRRAGVGVGTGLGQGRLFPFGCGGTIAPANSPIASENVPEFCRGNTDAFTLPYPPLIPPTCNSICKYVSIPLQFLGELVILTTKLMTMTIKQCHPPASILGLRRDEKRVNIIDLEWPNGIPGSIYSNPPNGLPVILHYRIRVVNLSLFRGIVPRYKG